jgi:hypothetical protein
MNEAKIIQLKPKKKATKMTKVQAEYARLLKKVNRSNKDVESLRTELEKGIQWINAQVQPRMTKWNFIKVDLTEQLVDELSILESRSDMESAILAYVNQTMDEINYTPVLNKEPYEEKYVQLSTRLHDLSLKEINALPKGEMKEAKKLIRMSLKTC